jgi:ketosteroid isomerase-like protein
MAIGSNSKRRIVLTALLVGLIAALPAAAIGTKHKPKTVSPKQAVEDMEERWRKAQLGGDAAAMGDLLSDDFVGITAFGKVNTKAQYLTRIRDRIVHLEQLDLSDVKVKIIGSHVAVVTSRAEIVGVNEGTPIKGGFRYTRVYQRISGVWKITSFEATRANGDAPPPSTTASAPQPFSR